MAKMDETAWKMAYLFDKSPVFTEMWNKSLRIVNNKKIKKREKLMNAKGFKKLEWGNAVLLLILSEGTT